LQQLKFPLDGNTDVMNEKSIQDRLVYILQKQWTLKCNNNNNNNHVHKWPLTF